MIPHRRIGFALERPEQLKFFSRYASCSAREMAEAFLARLRMIFASQSNRRGFEALRALRSAPPAAATSADGTRLRTPAYAVALI